MRRSVLVVGIVSMLVPATAALGQATEGPLRQDRLDANRAGRLDSVSRDANARFDPTRDTVKSMQTYDHLLKYGNCLANISRSGAMKAMDTKPYSADERRQTMVLGERSTACTLGKIENIHSLVRGTIAEALYKKNVTAVPALADDPGRASSFVVAENLFNNEREQGDQVMIGATNCMVATSPAKAHAVLRSAHGSNEEAAAMDALFAAAPACAGRTRPAGLSRSFLRAFIADSAWRFASGPAKLAQK